MQEGMARQQFTFFRSYYEALGTLSKRDRLAAYDAIIAYALDGAEPTLTGPAATAFILIRPVLDTGRRRARAGRRGGEASEAGGKPGPSPGQAEPKPGAREDEGEREQEKEAEKEKEKEMDLEREREREDVRPRPSAAPGGFRPPTTEEVREYVRQQGGRTDPERFVDFYTARGWMMGRSRMKDWRAAVRAWEARERPGPESGQGPELKDLQHTAPDAGELARMQKLRENMRKAAAER